MWVIVVAVTGNLLASSIPVLGPVYIAAALSKIAPQAAAAILVSLLFNSLDVLAGSAAFILAALLLLHRLFWPMIQRPLYAVYRFSPIKQKKWLVGIGFGLIFLSGLTIEALKALVEKF